MKNLIFECTAVSALESIGSEKAIEPLINTLTTDNESDVRRRAVNALGSIGNEKAIEPLINTLTTDKESNVRRSAADCAWKYRKREGNRTAFKDTHYG